MPKKKISRKSVAVKLVTLDANGGVVATAISRRVMVPRSVGMRFLRDSVRKHPAVKSFVGDLLFAVRPGDTVRISCAPKNLTSALEEGVDEAIEDVFSEFRP